MEQRLRENSDGRVFPQAVGEKLVAAFSDPEAKIEAPDLQSLLFDPEGKIRFGRLAS
jgi:hypothetical protein